METERLGGLFDGETKHQAGSIWNKSKVAPTIDTMQGGYREPMIIDDTYANRKPRTYEEYSPALRSDRDGFKTIVAMRGRNQDNPSDRTVGAPTEQRLEPNSQGLCNTLTSVQKDNLIMEVMQLGFMDNGTGQHQSNTVYDENALCPNITTIDGGGTQQIKVMTETVHIKQATSQGYIECEVGGVADFSYPDSKTRRGRVQDNGNTCPTLTAESQDICKIEKVGQISNDGSQYGTVIADNGLSPNLVAGTHGYANSCIATQYRIRKLTPRECWRLMDFSDEDFEKVTKVNSNTQLYKQAGNSIVRNVLVAILGQMIPGKEDVYKQ